MVSCYKESISIADWGMIHNSTDPKVPTLDSPRFSVVGEILELKSSEIQSQADNLDNFDIAGL